MKTKSIKSQITLIMIIGLVLFLLVSLFLYLSKSVTKKTSQEGIKTYHETAIDTQPIKEFIISCIEKVSKDAILLAGKQGGYIYKNQGGTLVDYLESDQGILFVLYGNMKTSYNILPPKFALATPEYPWKTFPYEDTSTNVEIYSGYFGTSNIPPLNSSEGPNSIQSQIETFIDNNLPACLDFDIFQNQGLEIVVQPPNTSIVIGSSDISITSRIPITISKPTTRELAELKNFYAKLNVRLRDTYIFTRQLVENDINNIKFDIKDISNLRDSFNIELKKNLDSNGQKYDLVIITDTNSLISGKPFQYIFARKNRIPSLYYIKDAQFPNGYTIKKEDFELKAEDPDEDTYTFRITPNLPIVLNVPEIKFTVEVSDGKSTDYQIVTVNSI